MTKSTLRAALLALVMLLVAACGGGSSSNADSPSEGNTADGEAPEEQAPTLEDTEQPSAEFVAAASLIDQESGPLEPGTWRVDTLDTPFTLSTTEDLFVFANDNSFLALATPTSTGPGDRDLSFIRPARLPDPFNPEYNLVPTRGWDVQDLDGWLDAMPAGVDVNNRTDITVGGFPAIRFDAIVNDDAQDCFPNQPCATFGDVAPWNVIIAEPNIEYRAWLVDLGEVEPLVIVTGFDAADSEWLDVAGEIVNTIGFGDLGPNSIRVAEAGTFELDVHDGITLTSDVPFVFNSDWGGSSALAQLSWRVRDVEFLTRPNGIDGNPIASSDNLITYLEEQGFPVTELDGTTVDGVETRVLEVGADRFLDALSRTSDTSVNFAPSPRARWWVTDHPDRGLLVTTAELWDSTGSEEQFEEVVAWGELLVSSLEFVEESTAEDLIGTWEGPSGLTWAIGPETIEITGGAVDSVSYLATADTLQWTDISGPRACPPNQTGTYEWEVVDDVLSLTLVSDPCGGRGSNLNGRTLERAG